MLILYSFLLLGLAVIFLVFFSQSLNKTSSRLNDLVYSVLKIPFFFLGLVFTPLILIALREFKIPYIAWPICLVLSIWFYLNFLKLYRLQSPFYLLELFYQKGTALFAKGDRVNEWIESVLDMGLKSISNRDTSLSHAIIQKFENFGLRLFQEKNKFSSRELFNYQFIQILNQLELLFQRAKTDHQTLLLTDIIQTESKLVLEALKKEPALSPLIAHFIDKDFREALNMGFYDVLETTSASLREVFKRLPEIPDLHQVDLKIVAIRLLSILEEIAKALFRKDKSTPIPFLNRPFFEIRDQLNQEPLRSHPDSETLLKQVNQIISEFITLETVLKTMPPIPSLVEETEEKSQNT